MIKKILLSDTPSILIKQNKEYIFSIIPELKECENFNQHNDYHHLDVLEHILSVVDNVDNNYILRIAALFHDIGKPFCFKLDEKNIGHFYGHWVKSCEIFNKYLNIFNLKEEEIELINNLIYYHDLNPILENKEKFIDIFKDNIDLLVSLKKADILSQNPKYLYRLEEIDKINKILRK